MAGCAMQVGGCSSEALGFLPTLQDIVRKDGALALYKCALPHSLLHSPLHELLSGPLITALWWTLGLLNGLADQSIFLGFCLNRPGACWQPAGEACMHNHMFSLALQYWTLCLLDI